jgi:hypothetical protein
MLARHMEEVAVRIRRVEAEAPEDHDARHEIIEQDARETWWKQGYEQGRAAERGDSVRWSARLTRTARDASRGPGGPVSTAIRNAVDAGQTISGTLAAVTRIVPG